METWEEYCRSKLPKTRIRRGKVVTIPEKWRGNVTTRKTIRNRPSKLITKRKRELNPINKYKDLKDIPLD